MAVSGSFYGSFKCFGSFVGVVKKIMAVFGSFMGVPSTWLHQRCNSPDSADHAQEPSRHSTS